MGKKRRKMMEKDKANATEKEKESTTCCLNWPKMRYVTIKRVRRKEKRKTKLHEIDVDLSLGPCLFHETGCNRNYYLRCTNLTLIVLWDWTLYPGSGLPPL